MSSSDEKEPANKPDLEQLLLLVLNLLKSNPGPSYADDAARYGIGQMRDDKLVAANDDVSVTLIKIVCVIAIVGGFWLLLYLRGVTLSATTVAEIASSAVIGIAARILISLYPSQTSGTDKPILETQGASSSPSDDGILSDKLNQLRSTSPDTKDQ